MLDISIVNKIYIRRVLMEGDEPTMPHARILFDYWQNKRAGRKYPDWPDIDLMELRQIAPFLVVKDVLHSGRDFRNRFWGTRITQHLGFDASGQTHLEVYKNQPDGPQTAVYEEVLATGRPNILHRNATFIAGREFTIYELLNMPLGPSEDCITHIISVADFIH